MAWIVKLDKDDFVGKWALEHMKERGPRELLVGFEMEAGAARRGRQVVARRACPSGRVTSARREPACSGRRSASPGCRPSWPRRTPRFEIRVDGRLEPARVRLRPFFDPEGERQRS